jgi:SAM-dependent methyltransferase
VGEGAAVRCGCGREVAETVFVKDGYRLGRCACGLVQVTNPPTDEELERFYSFSAGYGLTSLERVRRIAEGHARLLPDHGPGRLLDVGCGVGLFVAAARARGWDAAGIDLNADAVEVARERHGLPVTRGRIDELDEPDGAFDAITLWDTLEHVRDPRSALAAARRLVAPTGFLALSTPNIAGLYPRLSYPVGRRTGYWTHPEPPAHLFQFSVASLSLLLEEAGFAVERVRHERSPVKYTLAPGGLRLLARRPARAAYAAAFLPALLLGPLVRAGDEIVVTARPA